MGRRVDFSASAMVVSIRLVVAFGQKPEEARPGPMRSGDLFGDFGQGWITGAAVFEPVLGHRHGVGSAMPFADEPRPWFQGKTWRSADPTRGTQGLGQRLQLANCCFAKPTVLDLLLSVGGAEDQQVAADPRRIMIGKTG